MLIRLLKDLLKPWPARTPVHQLRCYSSCERLFAGRVGLEIGGSSPVFRRGRAFPVYAHAGRIDNCNFAHNTIWEVTSEDAPYIVDDECAPGRRYIVEATNLAGIAGGSYDFVLASHVLEHVANPLRAMSEWIRVLKDGVAMVLVLPHRDGTFDHRRPVTAMDHLVADFEQGTPETDLTHLEEILRLHDLERDPGAGDRQAFAQRSARNVENRGLHHHVFDTALAVQVANRQGLQIDAVETAQPYHIFIVGRKLDRGEAPRNEPFTGAKAQWWSESPFLTDGTSARQL